MNALFYLALIFAPMGAHFGSFSIGPFQMTPFRATILLVFFCLIFFKVKGDMLQLAKNRNQVYAVSFHFVWLLYAVFTIIWVIDTLSWFKSIYFLALGLIGILITVNLISNFKKIKLSFLCFQIGIFIQSMIGWYEIVTRNYLFRPMVGANYDYYVLSNNRIPIAMLGNPNDFATLMFVGVFVSLICAELSGKRFGKLMHYFILISYVALLFMTASRANILALLIASVFLLVLSVLRKKGKLVVLIIVVVLILAVTLFPILDNLLRFNFTGSSGSDVIRLNLIKNGFRFLYETFGLGVGAGQIESWMGRYAVGGTGGITNMHNWWMELLTAYGIPIFIGYLAFYIKLFLSHFRAFRKSEGHLGICSLYICATMVGFVIASVSSSSNISSEWLWVFWALCIACIGISKCDSGLSCAKDSSVERHRI